MRTAAGYFAMAGIVVLGRIVEGALGYEAGISIAERIVIGLPWAAAVAAAWLIWD